MMTLNCFLGLFFNGGLIYILATDKHPKTSFNTMCIMRAFNNIIVLIAAFMMVYVPKSLLGFGILPLELESFLICISLNCYLFNEFQSIYVSINRFIALYFSNYYNLLCGNWATFIVNFIIFIERVVHITLETISRISEEKFISFSPDLLTFTALEVSAEGMIWKTLLMFLVAFIANFCTFVKLTLFYLNADCRNDVEKWKLVRKNMRLFSQTILQDALFFIDNLFTYHMGEMSNHRFWLFICATFIWQSVHVMDGFIMIMFNDRLSVLKSFIFGGSDVSSG
ncbi:hypothetical protein B9Z55_019133 [Caenorhabditis nigoni]|nr:hypothetical protein B9Z55_019133 [Caenorhabditis nigoni]